MNRQEFLDAVVGERERQLTLPFDVVEFDKQNSMNDWVAYITSYVGRAACTERNDRECQEFGRNLVKVAALCMAAVEAEGNGYFEN